MESLKSYWNRNKKKYPYSYDTVKVWFRREIHEKVICFENLPADVFVHPNLSAGEFEALLKGWKAKGSDMGRGLRAVCALFILTG